MSIWQRSKKLISRHPAILLIIIGAICIIGLNVYLPIDQSYESQRDPAKSKTIDSAPQGL